MQLIDVPTHCQPCSGEKWGSTSGVRGSALEGGFPDNTLLLQKALSCSPGLSPNTELPSCVMVL